MKRQASIALTAGLLFAFTLIGCGQNPASVVAVPDQLTLFSIDGRQNDHDTQPGPDTAKAFYGYPVLGRVIIDDPKRRETLISALNRGIARSDGTMAKCFWPRHALRLENGEKTVDYLICFECLQFVTHEGKTTGGAAIDPSPQPAFDEELKRAGIPLAPSALKGVE